MGLTTITITDMATPGLHLESIFTHGLTCFALRPPSEGTHAVVRVFNMTHTKVSSKHFPPGTHVDNCNHKVKTVDQWVLFLPSLMKQSEEYKADRHVHLCVTDTPVDEEIVERATSMSKGNHEVRFILAEALANDTSYTVLSNGLFVPHHDHNDITVYQYGSYTPVCLECVSHEDGTLYPSLNVTSHTRITIVVKGDIVHELGFVGRGVIITVPSTQTPVTMGKLVHKIWYPVLLEILQTMENEVKGTHETLSVEDYALLDALSTRGRSLLGADHFKPSDDGARRAAREFQAFILSLEFDGKAKTDFDSFARVTNFTTRVRNMFDAHSEPQSMGLYRQVSAGHLF